MPKLSLLEKLNTAPKASFNRLDNVKSKRMGGVATLYIPSVDDVAKAIKAIPEGKTKTIDELREYLARIGNAETACPAKTIKYWKWMANLPRDLQEKYTKYDIPWWRVLKDGKASRHMPGGTDSQLLILRGEGATLDE